jgi:multidrug resistance efflux pump
MKLRDEARNRRRDDSPPIGEPNMNSVKSSLALAVVAPIAGFLISPARPEPARSAAVALEPRRNEPSQDRDRAGSTIVCPGRVEPIDGLRNLAFDVVGVLKTVSIQEGQSVEKGDVIAELANDDVKARLRAAEFEVKASAARLLKLKNGPREVDLEEAKFDVERRKAGDQYYVELSPRREDLFRKKAISFDEILEFRLRADVAAKEYRAASARFDQLKQSTRDEDLSVADAELKGAESRVAELKATLERTRLRAPSAGKILRLLRREGESVLGVEALPVVVMADLSRLHLRIEVDETHLDRVDSTRPVEFVKRGSPERKYGGKIERFVDLMGRRQLATDDPRDRVDTRVREAIVAPDSIDGLVIHQRVEVRVGVSAGLSGR